MKKRFVPILIGLALATYASTAAAVDPATSTTAPPKKVATAKVEGRSNVAVAGEATFTEVKDGVKLSLTLTGVPPGVHAVHLHEKGDCSAPDAMSAGGHFNPTSVAHGAPTADPHHAGDFGNMTVGADGKGKIDLTTKMLTVADGPNSVVGRAIIIHASEDDMKTQPTGNAGGRIGCGVFALKG